MLKVENIAVNYEETRALKDISLEIKEGEIVSIIGSNGAGKSTTLKAISGIVGLQSGNIEFKDKKINNLSPEEIVKAGISHCPEGRQLWPDMTVLENLEMGAFIRENSESIQKDIQETFDLFPILKGKEKQTAGSLSGGEQQALAVARALMSNPQLLLFDEPSLGLAPQLIKDIFNKIQLLRDEGKTILLVEQNANIALKTSDRTYVIEKGEVVLHGKSEELIENQEVKEIYLGM